MSSSGWRAGFLPSFRGGRFAAPAAALAFVSSRRGHNAGSASGSRTGKKPASAGRYGVKSRGLGGYRAGRLVTYSFVLTFTLQ